MFTSDDMRSMFVTAVRIAELWNASQPMTDALRAELRALPDDSRVLVFDMANDMQALLLRQEAQQRHKV